MAEPKPRTAIRRPVELGLKGEGRETVDALAAQLEDAGLPTPPATPLMTPISPDQLALPGTPQPDQGELALAQPPTSGSAPPDTVPHVRADTAVDSDPAVERH